MRRAEHRALSYLLQACDWSVIELPGAAGIGPGGEVCQEALGNAVSCVWLQPARLRQAFGPHLHPVIYYALTAIQLVFGKKIDERFGLGGGPVLSCMRDPLSMHTKRITTLASLLFTVHCLLSLRASSFFHQRAFYSRGAAGRDADEDDPVVAFIG